MKVAVLTEKQIDELLAENAKLRAIIELVRRVDRATKPDEEAQAILELRAALNGISMDSRPEKVVK